MCQKISTFLCAAVLLLSAAFVAANEQQPCPLSEQVETLTTRYWGLKAYQHLPFIHQKLEIEEGIRDFLELSPAYRSDEDLAHLTGTPLYVARAIRVFLFLKGKHAFFIPNSYNLRDKAFLFKLSRRFEHYQSNLFKQTAPEMAKKLNVPPKQVYVEWFLAGISIDDAWHQHVPDSILKRLIRERHHLPSGVWRDPTYMDVMLALFRQGVAYSDVSNILQVNNSVLAQALDFYRQRHMGRRNWVDLEVEFLFNTYSNRKTRSIARSLDRSESAVHRKANELGLLLGPSNPFQNIFIDDYGQVKEAGHFRATELRRFLTDYVLTPRADNAFRDLMSLKRRLGTNPFMLELWMARLGIGLNLSLLQPDTWRTQERIYSRYRKQQRVVRSAIDYYVRTRHTAFSQVALEIFRTAWSNVTQFKPGVREATNITRYERGMFHQPDFFHLAFIREVEHQILVLEAQRGDADFSANLQRRLDALHQFTVYELNGRQVQHRNRLSVFMPFYDEHRPYLQALVLPQILDYLRAMEQRGDLHMIDATLQVPWNLEIMTRIGKEQLVGQSVFAVGRQSDHRRYFDNHSQLLFRLYLFARSEGETRIAAEIWQAYERMFRQDQERTDQGPRSNRRR